MAIVTQAIYKKHDSFVEIRSKGRSVDFVRERIKRLRDALSLLNLVASEIDLLRRACEEALEGHSVTKEGTRFTLFPNVIEEIERLSDDDLPHYLIYRYRYDIYPQRFTLADFPPCIQIEPTSVCNYRCVFCYQTDAEFTRRSSGHIGHMKLDLFKRLIDEAEERCEAVTLASRGEPLLCPDIEAMLAYCKGKFLALKLNTNAWFLNEEKCHAILSSGVKTLVFSADAAAEPLYSRLRVGGRLDRVVANIQLFKQIRDRHYPHSCLITRVSGVHVSEEQNLEQMEAFWGEWVDQVAFVQYNPWENTYEKPVHDMTTPCSDLWRRMFVWFDGRVNPCDVDYKSTLSVGNAFEETLHDIWHSEAYGRLRQHHLEQKRLKVSPCNRCVVI